MSDARMPAGDVPLTIGVPVYNGERFLASCLDSLLAQDYQAFIVLISDNASTDRTAEIAASYVARDARIRYLRQGSNIGLYGNLNFLLRGAHSRYFKFANADDCWTPDMIRKAIACLEADPGAALCYPMMIRINEGGRETGRDDHRLEVADDDPATRFRRVLAELRLVNQLTGVMRTELAQRTMPMLGQAGADGIFLAELSLYGKILQLPEFHYLRRFHAGSSSFARASAEHQRRYVQAGGTGRLRFRHWRHHLGLVRRVLHSPVPLRAKAGLCVHLARRMLWDRAALGRDLFEGFAPAGKS